MAIAINVIIISPITRIRRSVFAVLKSKSVQGRSSRQ
jgi:hypothetical protein